MVAYPSDRQIQLAGAHAFTYDYLYTEESAQVQVYNSCVAPLVGSFFEGYNATILGQFRPERVAAVIERSDEASANHLLPVCASLLLQLTDRRAQGEFARLHVEICDAFLDSAGARRPLPEC